NKTNTSCFTTNYNVIELIYYEQSIYINNAITREKELKEWKKDSHNKNYKSIFRNYFLVINSPYLSDAIVTLTAGRVTLY
ncbi:MAG: hypothetical protein ACRCVU_20490, partial [Flavobacterium sp.]